MPETPAHKRGRAMPAPRACLTCGCETATVAQLQAAVPPGPWLTRWVAALNATGGAYCPACDQVVTW